ncbi:molybdenum cofactor biosynthesis protein MoaE [Thermodesulfobacteriota bacterium]
MDIEKIIEKIKNHENSGSIGMIASHLGIVRGFSRNGKDVDGVNVKYDMAALDSIIQEIKNMEGIVEVIVEINEGHLKVGDELMFVAVGGDIRENVFKALMEAVNRIKKNAASKEEIFST